MAMQAQRRAALVTPEKALTLAARELATAQHAFPPFRSPHEGYAILLEELDELWLEIKNDKNTPEWRLGRMRHEAMQIAAMSLRFMVDLA